MGEAKPLAIRGLVGSNRSAPQEDRNGHGGIESCAKIAVFSLSLPFEVLEERVAEVEDDHPLVLLSTHHLFAGERERLEATGASPLRFLSFADLIEPEEMEWCDAEADRIVVAEYGTRFKKIGEYYGNLTRLKNELILANLLTRYSSPSLELWTTDLGIHAQTWKEAGFNHRPHAEARAPTTTTSSQERPPSRLGLLVRGLAMLAQDLATPTPVREARREGEAHLLLGSLRKIEQYFHPDLEIRPPPRFASWALHLALNLGSFRAKDTFGATISGILGRFFAWAARIRLRGGAKHLAVAIHEESDDFGLLADYLGFPLHYLQDGFLPGHFPSRYLRYFYNVGSFLAWDAISGRIFDLHALPWQRSALFRPARLPLLEERSIDVERVVFLASGSGDWTAIKNRSDEDRAFELFVEVARRLPHVTILFRPHPLWISPEFHGSYSIQRLRDYTRSIELENLVISSGALRESQEFIEDGQKSRRSLSIAQEIAAADVVLGDHSQTLINAARTGKLFASVNASNRASLFDDFNQLGFPYFESTEGIVGFLNDLQNSTATIEAYNDAVRRYNALDGTPAG